MKNNLIKNLFLGFPIGVTISMFFIIIFNIIYKNEIFSFQTKEFIKIFILSGIIGSISNASILIFETDLSLLKQTIFHFSIIICTVFPICIWLKWISFNIISLLIFIVIYFIIYVILYLYCKINIIKINNKLK